MDGSAAPPNISQAARHNRTWVQMMRTWRRHHKHGLLKPGHNRYYTVRDPDK